jgi:hypothetical protein
MPILGIIASSFRSAAGPVGAYDALATVTVGSGGAASVSFVGIPSGYKHLQLRGIARTNNGGGEDYLIFRQNGISGTSYAYHQMTGNGSTVNAAGGASNPETYPGHYPGSTSGASIFGAIVIDMLDYANTNKYKTIRSLGGYDNNGAGRLGLYSGLFMDTTAISSFTLSPGAGSLFTQYSQFALYGVR